MNEKLGFVILHYNTEKETKDCVASILNHLLGASIVVVDNGSPNGSGKRLEKYYKDYPVTVLCLDNNLGFANGNNAGIQYVRNNSMAEFIVVMNNDTLILQDDFEKIVEEEYHKSEFAVMGPQITTKNGDKASNPVEYIVDSKEKVRKLILKRKIKLLLNEVHLNRLLHDVGIGSKRTNVYNPEKRYENVKLHGSCLIFSSRFFEYFSGFSDKTFLFFEEDILFLQIQAKHLKMVYNPQLKIIHMEDATTNSITKSNREKNVFVLENEIKSLKALNNIIDEINEGRTV